ncbi:conserved hypothetical protein [Altererythrobacter sp. B11]|uniref:hypothetical protein n=1 Tax=Altererythrobacter sp. B11 TaxID=2060312 RepID=UPI000DC6FC25|nr:hypothetical protein [Altererythrobacter sp. B11]BBC73154.1 conserved hypothetical protein [Altererythrobacter sp. B11]
MRGVVVIGVALLAGCSDRPTPEEQAIKDEQDIALVKQANDAMAPLQPLAPEAINEDDATRYDLQGAGCRYAPGTNLGTRVVARPADAFMKIDGEVIRFAADPGSRELQQGTHTVYNSRAYVLQLALADEARQRSEGEDAVLEGEGAAEAQAPDLDLHERMALEGTVTLRDEHGRIVYEGVGPAQCGTS